MSYLIVIALLLSGCYVLLIFSGLSAWDWRNYHTSVKKDDILSVSIIIPARNEEKYIKSCLLSILSNDFSTSKYEIIVIDDHSDDNTTHKINSLQSKQITVLSLPEDLFGKKSAIAYGVSKAKYPIILCTDADSVVGKHWLSAHVSVYTDVKNVLSTGLVLPDENIKLLSRFQFFDFAASMIITHYGIIKKRFFLANGANISYRKEIFENIEGFKGNDHIASGDDLFLIQKVARQYPDGISFITSKEAMVVTKSEESWTSFFNQRLRWASKSMRMDAGNLKTIQAFVFLYSAFIIIALFFCMFYSPSIFFIPLLITLSVKLLTDYIFLNGLSYQFNRSSAMNSFILSFWIYFLHIIMSGFIALYPKSYKWKGRRVA